MKIMLARTWPHYEDRPVETYSRSMARVLREQEHEVIEVPKKPAEDARYDHVDLLLDIDCGRDEKGKLHWHGAIAKPKGCVSAVVLIDSHGNPSLHHRLAKNYDHAFFAVWDKRDLFTAHPSAHWCPNFTDLAWFNGEDYPVPKNFLYNFGFFGSKGGLDRADPMIKIANDRGWRATARQVNIGTKHRWPRTAECMAECQFLFNKGQKHDGPNLRVMESMLMQRPLISDRDPRSGMDKLFEEGIHYLGYDYFTNEGLEDAMGWVMTNPTAAQCMAEAAYDEVRNHHLVEHRIAQILEVVEND
jgi:hypothetical protein